MDPVMQTGSLFDCKACGKPARNLGFADQAGLILSTGKGWKGSWAGFLAPLHRSIPRSS